MNVASAETAEICACAGLNFLLCGAVEEAAEFTRLPDPRPLLQEPDYFRDVAQTSSGHGPSVTTASAGQPNRRSTQQPAAATDSGQVQRVQLWRDVVRPLLLFFDACPPHVARTRSAAKNILYSSLYCSEEKLTYWSY